MQRSRGGGGGKHLRGSRTPALTEGGEDSVLLLHLHTLTSRQRTKRDRRRRGCEKRNLEGGKTEGGGS